MFLLLEVAHLLQDKRLETSLTGVDHRNVALKLVAMAAIALALAIPACSMLHREKPSPQQQFLEALKRGDSIQASRVWLDMDPKAGSLLSLPSYAAPASSVPASDAPLSSH